MKRPTDQLGQKTQSCFKTWKEAKRRNIHEHERNAAESSHEPVNHLGLKNELEDTNLILVGFYCFTI